MGHEAAFHLRSREGYRNVAFELHTILGQVLDGYFNYANYRALSQLVIKKALSIDIWHAVLDLIT